MDASDNDDEDEQLVSRGFIMSLVKPDDPRSDRNKRMAAKAIIDELAELRSQTTLLKHQNEGLEHQVKELKKTKKKRSVTKPNPNARFQSGLEIAGSRQAIEALTNEPPKKKNAVLERLVQPWLWLNLALQRRVVLTAQMMKTAQFRRHYGPVPVSKLADLLIWMTKQLPTVKTMSLYCYSYSCCCSFIILF